MKYKLGEVCRFYSGTGFPVVYQGLTDEELPFYKVGDIANNVARGKTHLELCNNYISRETAAEIKGVILPKDTVVFAKIGEALKLNRRAITSSDCLIDNNAMGIAPKSDYLRTRYFFFFMKQLKMQDYAESTTVPSVRKSKLEEIEINVPTFDEQAKIETLLDRVSKVVLMRQQELQKLDELVKARFVEMFGDPLRNTKNWETEKLSGLCKAIYGGGTPSKSHPEYFEGDIPWVSPKDMKSMVITDSIDHITEEAVKNSSTKMVPVGAVLMVIRSGILKHTLPVALAAVNLTVNQDMKAFIVGDRISPEYLIYFFKAIEKDVLGGVRGVTADNIDFKDFQNRMVIVPPLSEQNAFSRFVKQVDKSKVAVQEALNEAQLLFDSLMQKCFQ